MATAIPRSSRRWLVIAGLALVGLIIALNVLSGFYVDLLWFREVHLGSVFWTVFWTKFLLGLIFGVIFFVLLFVNLLIVRRITPRFPYSPEQEVIERYRLAVEPYVKWILPGFAAFIALLVGIGVSGRWQLFQLWRNSSGVTFGRADPVFHRDAGFYVFSLPWLEFLQGWLFSALVGVTVLTAIAHYLWGGIRLQAVGEKVTPQVKAHLSVLLGLIVLTKAWGYRLGQFDLLTSPRGVVSGASYTDVHAQLPALKLLMVIAVVCSVLFLVNIRFQGWALPLIGLGLLALSSIVVGAIFPAAIQKFRVAPQELQQERPYIARNIAATRTAFGLDKITEEQRPIASDLTTQDLKNDDTTVSNIRLWDPSILKQNFDQLQRIRQFYEFQDVDVDRYLLSNQERMVMISTREVSQNGIPGGGTWQNKHLVYTHGYGVVANQVNSATTEGAPLFIEQDIPPTGDLPIDQPRVYYGEREDVPYVLVHSGVQELDYQGTPTNDQAQVTTTYTGEGGIRIGGIFGKMLFAWRYKDINLLISNLVTSDSRILIYRNIQARIPKPAPFLKYDGDPYSAVVDGRIVWIQDAYTTTSAYPYSQELNLFTATGKNHLVGTANYIRNSVKVVVDAYDGTMTYYVVDQTDPIIQVWEKVFPHLFTPVSEAPAELRAHFRYPEDLFSTQAYQFQRYHVTDPTVFYGRQDVWAIPSDPAAAANVGPNAAPTPLHPYYVLMRLPDQTNEEFDLILPFTPSERNNMIAWMAAKSDPAEYGKVTVFEFPSGALPDGPVQVFNRINSNPTFSSERTLLGQGGSSVLFGNFLVVPLADSFLYVQPIFVQSKQAGSFPQLKRVVVVHGGSVGIGATLSDAIDDSFGGQVTPPPSGGPPPTGGVNAQVKALIAQALADFQAADAALRAGDLATYAKEVAAAEAAISQADALLARSVTGPSPSPSPSASPTP